MADVKETEKKVEKKNVITSKFGKQKQVDVPITDLKNEIIGNRKVLLNYPGTQKAQQMQDILVSGNGYYDLVDFYERLMKDVILKPKVSYDYFDKKLKKEDKAKQITVAGVTYDLKFEDFRTGMLVAQFSQENSPDARPSDYAEELMSEVIKANGKKTNYDYWDQHDGYQEVLDQASDFVQSRLAAEGFMSLMNAAAFFLITVFNK